MTDLITEESMPTEDERRASEEAARVEAELARAAADEARAEAEESHQRFSFLAEASRLLGSSLDYETTLQNVARMVVPWLGDFCVVDLAEDGQRIRRVAVADVDPQREKLVWRIAREHPLSVQAPPTYSTVLSTGESQWLPEVTDEMCLALPVNADPEVMGSLRFRSFICVPLPVHGQILGTISIARSTSGRSYTSIDLALCEELARRAGLAVDHARLYRASENANRAKDEFLATLSHELRSPLSSILLCVQMLRRGILDEEKTARALETIERKVGLEVRLVDDLVDVSRIAAGKLSLELEVVDLGAVVYAAIEGVRGGADLKGVELRFVPDLVEVPVLGDETRLQQVMGNLLSNAIKFTPRGGSVDVTCELLATKARVTVHDTGVGISAEGLPEIFEPFRQVDTSSTRSFGGLGLGLAIVRKLIELHGGQVVAESEGPDLGSTFVVTMPLLPTPDAAKLIRPKAPSSADVLEDLSGLRLLLVDDEEDARESAATLLTSCGAVVITAATAAEALGILEREIMAFDVLISDISMPVVDGYALLMAIQASRHDDVRRVPAIAVTARAGSAERLRALAAGFRSYLAKPVDERALVSAVAAFGRNGGGAANSPLGPGKT